MSSPPATVSVTYEQARVAVASHRVASRIADRPFPSADALVAAARDEWWNARVTDWLESFAAHPRIASKVDVADLSAKSRAYSSREQTGAAKASDAVKQEFAEWNARYDEKFGHIFMVYASGRSAESMLAELKQRYNNPPYAEIALNAIEHMKITDRRLRALVVGALTPPASQRPSPRASPLPSPPRSPHAAAREEAAAKSKATLAEVTSALEASFAFSNDKVAAAAAAAVAAAGPPPDDESDEGEEEPPPGYGPGAALGVQLDSFAFAKPPAGLAPIATRTPPEVASPVPESPVVPAPPPPPPPPPASRLASVARLLEAATSGNAHPGLAASFASATWVGALDGDRALIQSGPALLLVHLSALARDAARQAVLRRVDAPVRVALDPPAGVADLVRIALVEEEGVKRAGGGGGGETDAAATARAADLAARLLTLKRGPLSDHLGVDVTADGRLAAVPCVLPGATPQADRLPALALALARDVAYDSESRFFDTAADALAAFASPPCGGEAGDAASTTPFPPPPPAREWEMEHVLLPAVRRAAPQRGRARDGSVVELTRLEKLYRVFERC